MSVRKEVELIIEHNITKRTRVNHFGWDPCATSTPVRKPLNTLNNFEPGFGYNQYDIVPRNISFKTTPKKLGEGQNFEGNSSKKTARKNKTKSRNNSFYRCHDDEESDDNEHNKECPKGNESKKNLIIKLGSSQFDSQRIKRTKKTGEAKKEASLNSICKRQNKITKKKVICGSASNKNKLKGNNSIIILSASCEKRKKTESGNSSDNGKTESSNYAVFSDSFTNNLGKRGLVSDTPETEKDIEDVYPDSVPCKRKNKTTALKHVISKKPKSDPDFEVSGLKNNDGDSEEMEYNENILDKSIKESKTKLSNSHEIFSENKERELRDSLNLTASAPATEEFNNIPESDHTEIIPVFQKKQKAILKKKISDSDNKLKFKPVPPNKVDAAVAKPKRARKSLKDFWLPMSEDSKVNKDSIHEFSDSEKVKEVLPSSPSTVQIMETASKKIMTLIENGSSNSFTNKDFFNDVREMEFTEIPSNGNEREVYSYALGWKFRAFKCGALKIGKKCESSGRTEHENSHFGGVLLEGKLLMKIQENEMELSSGQMFCVPPLTDWKATNITREDCILYYWCGRF